MEIMYNGKEVLRQLYLKKHKITKEDYANLNLKEITYNSTMC
jgi:hypothetical protein